MLTNFKTVLKSLKRLSKLEELIQSPYATKKEKRFWKKRKELLEADFAGILRMVELPKVLFVVDLIREKTAVAEARKLGIPIVGVVDTNANPELVDYPIPANDDATGSVSLIVKLIGQAIQEGKKKMKARAKEQLAGAEKGELPLSDGELLEQPEALRAEKEQEKVEGEEERAKHNIRSKTR